MEPILLESEFSIKKLDPKDEKDIWLARQMDKDSLINGIDGYLWSIEDVMKRSQIYLSHTELYDSPYAIYDKQNPVGYIELSPIHTVLKYVDISYALLEKERGKGYATKALKAVTKLVLEDGVNDIKNVTLTIDWYNMKSQMVAIRAGFINHGFPEQEYKDLESITYIKTKQMLYREQHKK